MNGTCVWSDDEYHQRCDVDCRMKEQKWKSFAKIVAGTAEEDFGHQLDGLASDGNVVEQGNRIGLGAIQISQ